MAVLALDDPVSDLAELFVRSGRLVPGLTVTDGRARSWWWPLPAASDRTALAALLDGNDTAAHRHLAHQLTVAVDRAAREQLEGAGVALLPRWAGRGTVPDAWLRSLTRPDPWLPAWVDLDKATALATEVEQWVRSGVAALGQARVCLRIHEPLTARSEWQVEALAQDIDEPSVLMPLAEVWTGESTFGPEVREELLAGLGAMVRVAPELAPILDGAAPDRVDLDDHQIVSLLRDGAGLLADLGIVVLLPAWWTNRAHLGLQARTAKATRKESAVVASGFGLEQILAFTWQAALGDRRLTPADLRALEKAADAKRSLIRVRGHWIEFDTRQIAALLAHHGRPDEASAGQLLRAGLGLDRDLVPDPDLPLTGVHATGWLGRLLDDALHSRVRPIPTPDGFEGQLRPYQERGLGWLVFLGRLGLGACLADDMGLGKTAQLIAAVLADDVGQPTLVVAPTSVLGNWERELARFAPSLPILVHHGRDRFSRHPEPLGERVGPRQVVVTSYGLVVRDLAELSGIDWGRIVLDEAQQVKNHHTAHAKAVNQLSAARRIALTGTPVENRLTELWAIMQSVNPGLLGTVTSFRQRFSLPIERDADPEATARLQRIVSPFVLRRLKSDRSIITDLPDKIEVTEHCPLTAEQATLYQAVVADLLEAAEGAEGIDRRGIVLAGIMKLKQLCNHPAHFLKDGSRLPGRSGKLIRAEELIEELLAAGDKALCFTQFTAWGEALVPYLARRFGVEVLWLHGRLPRPRRDELVARFQHSDGPPLLVLSLKAGGTGLNLTAASHVLHFDRWWNPAVEDQATDRAYRIGQQRNVIVNKLVAAGTVEERIDDMITSKRALAQKVVGAGESWITELSTDDLRQVLTLRAGSGED